MASAGTMGAADTACIRCGDCIDACPEALAPARLFARLDAGDLEGALDRGLMACTECGACDAACPSALPLLDRFRKARDTVRAQQERRAAADAAGRRFRERTARLARLAERADAAQARRIQRIGSAAAAALAKARAKRGGPEA